MNKTDLSHLTEAYTEISENNRPSPPLQEIKYKQQKLGQIFRELGDRISRDPLSLKEIWELTIRAGDSSLSGHIVKAIQDYTGQIN